MSKLDELSLDQIDSLTNEIVEATMEELQKGDIYDNGPTSPSHSMPGFKDDEEMIDAKLESEHVATKAKEVEGEEDEDEDEEKVEKKDMDKSKKTSNLDLVKSNIKNSINSNLTLRNLTKSISALNEKIERIAKGPARDRKSATTVEEIEVIEKSAKPEEIQKGHVAVNPDEDFINPLLRKSQTYKYSNYDRLIIKNAREFVQEGLLELQKAGKLDGAYISGFEVGGIKHLPEKIKKAGLEKAGLLK